MIPESITIGRAQFEQAAATLAFLTEAQKNPQMLQGGGFALSHVRGVPRAYAHPAAALQLAKCGVPEAEARRLLGGHAYRDYHLFAQQPAVNEVHVDAVLTQMSVAYRNAEYIGPSLVPRVQVTKRSDVFFIYDKANLRRQATKRAPGGSGGRSGYGLSTDNYSVETYTQEHVVPDEIRDNADNPLDPDRDGVNFATDILDLEYEMQAASMIETSGNWTTNVTLSGTSQWSDYDDSDPLSNMMTAHETVLKQIARRANTLQMSFEVFTKLALHPDLIDRVKYTGTQERPAMVTAAMMAALFMVDQVLVGTAVKNTAKEGQTDSMSFVWSKHAWLGFVAPAPALTTPSAAYAFTIGRQSDRYRENPIKSDIIRVEEAWDIEKVESGAGYRFIDAVA